MKKRWIVSLFSLSLPSFLLLCQSTFVSCAAESPSLLPEAVAADTVDANLPIPDVISGSGDVVISSEDYPDSDAPMPVPVPEVIPDSADTIISPDEPFGSEEPVPIPVPEVVSKTGEPVSVLLPETGISVTDEMPVLKSAEDVSVTEKPTYATSQVRHLVFITGSDGKKYWYENNVRQGVSGPPDATGTYRGKEIYDPASNAWYWLDAVQGGAVATGKDVFMPYIYANESEYTGGKWVRYDASGSMVKGWNTNRNGTYFFDPITGAMVKGVVTINDLPYFFDLDTGIRANTGWYKIEGRDYWYEDGVRQGLSGRGKEIYDASSEQWYWLDAVQDGAKAVSKDVYHPYTYYGKDTTGKWVRYNADGIMIKGWHTNSNGTYYFDLTTGAMAKGKTVIDGKEYEFDSSTGILIPEKPREEEQKTMDSEGARGIDVSRYQNQIDWDSVKDSGISFAIIRVGTRGWGTGVLSTDSLFHQNARNATAAGLKIGVYVYSTAINEAEAIEEANLALREIAPYRITYPVFIDLEASATGQGRSDNLSVNQRTRIARAFCETIEQHGYKAGIYANKSWFDNKMDTPSLSEYSIWLAQWNTRPTYTRTGIDIWQYSSKGSVPGISGDVDMDIAFTSY